MAQLVKSLCKAANRAFVLSAAIYMYMVYIYNMYIACFLNSFLIAFAEWMMKLNIKAKKNRIGTKVAVCL